MDGTFRQKSGRDEACMESFLVPNRFDLICEVAKEFTTSHEKTLKMGFLLGHLCDNLIGNAFRIINKAITI